jgi:hypothetical protein
VGLHLLLSFPFCLGQILKILIHIWTSNPTNTFRSKFNTHLNIDQASVRATIQLQISYSMEIVVHVFLQSPIEGSHSLIGFQYLTCFCSSLYCFFVPRGFEWWGRSRNESNHFPFLGVLWDSEPAIQTYTYVASFWNVLFIFVKLSSTSNFQWIWDQTWTEKGKIQWDKVPSCLLQRP